MTRINILALGLVATIGTSVAFSSSPLGLHDLLQESFQSAPSESPFPVRNATRSFWMEGAPGVNPFAHEGSSGHLTTDADVCIIGSGITGVSVAYHLSELMDTDPLSVVIFEARDFCAPSVFLPYHCECSLFSFSGSGATGAVPPPTLALIAIDARALGRNGGHLSAHNFMGFVKDTATWGIFDAIKSVLIEEHVVDAITSLVKNAGLENEVDLVEGVRTNLFFTAEEKAKARGEYEAARAAGVDVSAVEWLSRRKVEAVRPITAILSS